MPELDFAVVCDYVRSEGGVAHVIGGGFDTIHAVEFPTGHNVGIWARVLLHQSECERPHRFELYFQTQDGERLTEVKGPIEGAWPPDFPAGWKVGIGLALNLGVPLPAPGIYSFELLINDNHMKSIPIRVLEAA